MLAASIDRYLAADDLYAERNAYNAAFYELGLQWHWDAETYAALQSIACEQQRIRDYVQAEHAHLLTAYDMDFLVSAIQSTKARCSQLPAHAAARRAAARCRPAGRAAEIGF